MKRAFLGLGSNIGDREDHLQRAIILLRGDDLAITAVSPVYETAPQGFLGQGWFLNLVVEVQTSLLPLQLLHRCQRVERNLGRKRLILNGPRAIDVDVLFYEHAVIHAPELEVPHPRYAERRFVLAPLADLAPEWRDPVTRHTVRELLARTSDQAVRKTAITFDW